MRLKKGFQLHFCLFFSPLLPTNVEEEAGFSGNISYVWLFLKCSVSLALDVAWPHAGLALQFGLDFVSFLFLMHL